MSHVWSLDLHLSEEPGGAIHVTARYGPSAVACIALPTPCWLSDIMMGPPCAVLLWFGRLTRHGACSPLFWIPLSGTCSTWSVAPMVAAGSSAAAISDQHMQLRQTQQPVFVKPASVLQILQKQLYRLNDCQLHRR